MFFGRYDVGNGLLSNYVIDIEQDAIGYLWVATDQGINVFNGHQFRHIGNDEWFSQGITHRLCPLSEGGVLVLSSTGRLAILRADGTNTQQNLSGKRREILDVAVVSSNRFFIAEAREVSMFAFDKLEVPIWSISLEGSTQSRFFRIDSHSVLVKIGNSFWILRADATPEMVKLNNDGLSEQERAFFYPVSLFQNQLLLSDNRGNYIYGDLFAGSFVPKGRFTSLAQPSDGIFYRGKWIIVSELYGIQLIDPANPEKGLNLTQQSNVEGSMFRDLFVDRDSLLWIGSFGTGLYKIRSDGFKTWSSEPILKMDKIANVVWMFDDQEVVAYDIVQQKTVTLKQADDTFMRWRNAAVDRNGNWWFGSFRYLIGPMKWSELGFNRGKFHRISHGISRILVHSTGVITYGTYGDGLRQIDLQGKEQVVGKRMSDRSLVVEDIFNIDGKSWFSTFGQGIGYVQADSLVFHTQEQGLLSNYAYHIARIEDQLVVSGNNGISISSDSGKTWKKVRITGASDSRIIQTFSRRGRLFTVGDKTLFEMKEQQLVPVFHVPLVFNTRERIIQAFYAELDDQLWINSTQAARSHPMHILESAQHARKPIIELIEITGPDGKNKILKADASGIKLPFGTREVYVKAAQLQYHAIFEQPLRISINGGALVAMPGNEWRLQNPAPGKFVIAIHSEAGSISTNEGAITFTFVVNQPFWLSFWFVSLIALIIAVLSFTLVKKRTALKYQRQLKKLELEHSIQKERHRIARELHDSVGASLTYIITSVDDALKVRTEGNYALLEKIKLYSRSMMGQLRETIWAINKESVTAHQLAEKIHSWSLDYFDHDPAPELVLSPGLQEFKLSPGQTLNLFRMLQEALQNVKKHAAASRVEIRFSVENDVLTIHLQDNGKGFDVKTGTHTGYGLSNLKARAMEMEAKLNIESGKKGTLVIISMPKMPVLD